MTASVAASRGGGKGGEGGDRRVVLFVLVDLILLLIYFYFLGTAVVVRCGRRGNGQRRLGREQGAGKPRRSGNRGDYWKLAASRSRLEAIRSGHAGRSVAATATVSSGNDSSLVR